MVKGLALLSTKRFDWHVNNDVFVIAVKGVVGNDMLYVPFKTRTLLTYPTIGSAASLFLPIEAIVLVEKFELSVNEYTDVLFT